MCTSGVKVPTPGASTQVVLPLATVAGTVTAVGTSTPFVATPAPVVEQPGMHAREFPTLRLSESPELLPSFRLSSSSPSPTLPWGAAEDSSPPFLPNRVQAGHSQDVPDEGSLFNVSPLSPGLFFRPPRGSKSPPTGGALLPTTLEDFDDSVLGDPITYVRCEKFPGSESSLSFPVYAWPSGLAFQLNPTVLQTVLASGTSALPAEGTSTAAPPMDSGEGRLLETGLPGCPYRFSESGGLPFTDGNPAYGLQLHHPRFLELVGAPESARLLDCSPTFWMDQLGKEQAMTVAINLQRDAGVMLSNLQILSQFAMVMNRMSFSMMALGLGQSLFPRVEVDDLSPAPRAARAASYMSAMGLWRPQTGTSFVLPLVYELQILLSGGSASSGVSVLIQILHLHDQPVRRYILYHELKLLCRTFHAGG